MHEGATNSARRAEKTGTRPREGGLGECEWRDTCGSDVPPLDVVESLTWKREEGVPLDGAWNMHEESPWLSGGARRGRVASAHAWLGEKETCFPSDGVGEGGLTFMILSRSSKKRWGLSGFVKR